MFKIYLPMHSSIVPLLLHLLEVRTQKPFVAKGINIFWTHLRSLGLLARVENNPFAIILNFSKLFHIYYYT